MARKDYSEDILVQEPTAAFMQDELRWKSFMAFNEEGFGASSLLGRSDDTETVLIRDLDAALRRINPNLPEQAYEQATRIALADDATKGLLQINEEKYQLLREGVLVERVRHDDGRVVDERLFLIDFDNPANNEFKVVRELWVKGRLHRRRPDVIGFVNGLPLVFIELKRFEVHVDNAYKKNYRDYLDTIPQLFHWNSLIIISNGADAQFGSLTSTLEHFYRWKRLDEDDPEPGKTQPLLPILLRGMLARDALLDIVENFILFDHSEGDVAKIIARNHQYLGVNRVIERLTSTDKKIAKEVKEGKLGVFWHTQGSGKSYSMVFLSEKVQRKVSAGYTFVVMTDRKELDEQIFGTFTNSGAATNKKAMARSGDQLEKLLKADHRYVFSLIHKFHQRVDEPYTERDNVIVISDEAHRTQYGRFAMNMRKALPHAKFIGFTGTPLINNTEKQLTREVFGDYVSVYDFQRAVADGATLPLFYENRGDKLKIVDEDINKRIAERIEQAKEAGELTPEEEEKLYRELARDYPVLTSGTRLHRIAEDFVAHYSQRQKTGKAMLVFMDKITCVRTHDLIQHYWQQTQAELEAKVAKEEARFAAKGKLPDRFTKNQRERVDWMAETEMCVVVSQEQGEIEEFKKWQSDVDPAQTLDITPHREKMVNRDLEKEFKKKDHPFRVAIVCAMWLTGFDVKPLATLYLDKPMKGHTLMQAIARVNRVTSGKKHGLIIDYNGMLKSLRKALATFAQGDRTGKGDESQTLRDDGEALAEYGEAVSAVIDFLDGVGFQIQPLIDATGFNKQALIMQAANVVVETPERRKTFEVLAEDVDGRLRGLFPHPGLFEYDKQENAISSIYRFIQDSRDTPDVSDMLQALYDVVDMAVDTEKPKVNEQPARYDLSHIDLQRLKAEFESNCPNIKLMNLQEKIESRLQAMMRQNPSRADLYEKYQAIIDEYNNDKDKVEVQRVFDELNAVNAQLTEEEKRFLREGLDNQQQLAVFDMLQKDKLSAKEREEVKQVARELMDSLAAGKLRIENFKEKATAQAQIKIEIIDHLLASMPQGLYEDDELNVKADQVFTHLMQLGDSEIEQVVLH